MKAVLQRVTRADVHIDTEIVGHIDHGLLVLLGVAKGDTEADARYITDKLVSLRIFSDAEGKMNRSVVDIGGKLLVVSQFTLLGDTTKGRRPGFDRAASPHDAQRLYESVISLLRDRRVPVETGRFGAHMRVSLDNDGPVTFLLDSRNAGGKGQVLPNTSEETMEADSDKA